MAWAPSCAIVSTWPTTDQRNGMATSPSTSRPMIAASPPDSGAGVPGGELAAVASCAYMSRACSLHGRYGKSCLVPLIR